MTSLLLSIAPYVISFVIALVAIFVFEAIRQPRLEVRLPSDPKNRTPIVALRVESTTAEGTNAVETYYRFVKIEIVNSYLVKWPFWIPRIPAQRTRCFISVLCADGKTMDGFDQIRCKWDATLQPSAAGNNFLAFDYLAGKAAELDLASRKDGELIGVACKRDGDCSCYIWSVDKYQPNRLQGLSLPEGDFNLSLKSTADNLTREKEVALKLSNHGSVSSGLTLSFKGSGKSRNRGDTNSKMSNDAIYIGVVGTGIALMAGGVAIFPYGHDMRILWGSIFLALGLIICLLGFKVRQR